MLTIPLNKVANQTLSVILAGQNCTLNIYAKLDNLFCDVGLNGSPIVTAVICQNLNFIVCRNYSSFAGNLMFIDTQGESDPNFDGLGDRYQLLYLTAAEYVIAKQ
jgi:hypothetical protein